MPPICAQLIPRTLGAQRVFADPSFDFADMPTATLLMRSDVEEITRKTGHHQPFGEFVKMLGSAIRQEHSNAVLDILTYSDLLALKSRKKPDAEVAPTNGNNKRYVILTHSGRQRVHYPLPLAPVDAAAKAMAAAPDTLPRPHAAAAGRAATIAAPQQQRPAVSRASRSDQGRPVAPPATEFRTHRLPERPQTADGANGLHVSTRQYDELLREKEDIQAAYERLQRDSTREISKVRRRCEDLASQLQEQQDSMAALQGELMAQGGDGRVLESLKRKLRRAVEAQSQLSAALARQVQKESLCSTPSFHAQEEEDACAGTCASWRQSSRLLSGATQR